MADFKINIPKWIRTDTSYHVIFWLGLYVALILLDPNPANIRTLIKELFNLGFFMIIVYFNFRFLIPNYLKKNYGLNYAIALVLTALILTPLKTISFIFLFTDRPTIQSYFVTKQETIFFQFLFYGTLSTIFQIIMDWQKGTVEKKELQLKNTETELNFLKSQINPHFLFNTLNNLYALTLKKSEQAPEVVLKLSEMMRYMLYECNEPKVPLIKEVSYLENYLELEKLRQKNQFNIRFNLEGKISDQKIAPLIFIPFLENSIKHGLNHQLGNEGYIDIDLVVIDQEIAFAIENSKSAFMPQSQGKKSGGIGLVNVQRRLDLLYPNRHELVIENNPNNFRIHLKINLT